MVHILILDCGKMLSFDHFIFEGEGSPGSELGEGQVRCPVCATHLQASDIGAHYAQEVDRLVALFR